MTRLLLMPVVLMAVFPLGCAPKTAPSYSGPEAAPATSRPATGSVPAVSPQVRKLLDQLEMAGRKYAAIRADIDYEVVNRKLGDSETRTGWIAYQRGDRKASAKFRVHFDTLQQGQSRKVRDEVDYAFDGRWLTVAKHRIKQITRYEIAREGEKASPLKLGKGPFPLPFGQEADEVIELFLATTRPLRGGEPKDTDYIKLVPRPRYRKQMSFVRLEMWVGRKRHLPVKIISRDHSKNITTVVFKKIKTPKSFKPDMFRLPRKAGWTYTEKRLGGE